MSICRIFLLLQGLGFAIYGAYLLFNPQFLSDMIMNVAPFTPAATTEVRAMYGGAEFGLGVYWIVSALQQERSENGILCMVLIFAGLSSFRGIGLFLDGPQDAYNLGAFSYEFASALIGCGCLIKARASQQQTS